MYVCIYIYIYIYIHIMESMEFKWNPLVLNYILAIQRKSVDFPGSRLIF